MTKQNSYKRRIFANDSITRTFRSTISHNNSRVKHDGVRVLVLSDESDQSDLSDLSDKSDKSDKSDLSDESEMIVN